MNTILERLAVAAFSGMQQGTIKMAYDQYFNQFWDRFKMQSVHSLLRAVFPSGYVPAVQRVLGMVVPEVKDFYEFTLVSGAIAKQHDLLEEMIALMKASEGPEVAEAAVALELDVTTLLVDLVASMLLHNLYVVLHPSANLPMWSFSDAYLSRYDENLDDSLNAIDARYVAEGLTPMPMEESPVAGTDPD